MKIELQYREIGTQIPAYIFNYVFDATEAGSWEALAEYRAAERLGYEITVWRLVHDEDVSLPV